MRAAGSGIDGLLVFGADEQYTAIAVGKAHDCVDNELPKFPCTIAP
jgi:hypothetical protein